MYRDSTVNNKPKEKMKVTIQDGKLIIEIEMQPPTPSASGKTLVVASSRGNVATSAIVDGKPVVVGLNCYINHESSNPVV